MNSGIRLGLEKGRNPMEAINQRLEWLHLKENQRKIFLDKKLTSSNQENPTLEKKNQHLTKPNQQLMVLLSRGIDS